MRRGLFILPMMALLLGLVLSPRLANAQVSPFGYVEIIPFEGTLRTSCLGEPVHIHGSATYVVHYLENPNGREHQLDRATIQASGTGLITGTRYRYNAVMNHVATWMESGGAGNFTRMSRGHLISAGSGGNLVATFMLHITANANGETTVVMDVWEVECRA